MDTNAPDLAELKARLVEQLEALAEKLMGPPNPETQHSREWRWGSNGGRALVIRGPKRGGFHDHEDGTRGDVLQFIRSVRSYSFPEAVKWAAGWLRLDGAAPPRPTDPAVLTERARKRAQAAAEASADKAERITNAQAIWDAARAVDGTPAAAYLAKTRGIPAPASGWPDAVRWHPRSRALTLAATTVDGTVKAVQRVFLTENGGKIDEAEAEARRLPSKAKNTNGVLAGASVRLPGDPAGPLLLAEGPETGLSLWAATGHETRVALGSFANHVPPIGRRVVVCRDDDPRQQGADQVLQKVVNAWRAAGVDVVVATPWPERRGDTSDFNDVLCAGGVDAVRARIAAALNPGTSSGSKRVPIAAGRQLVDEAVVRFFTAFEDQGWKRTFKAGGQLVHAIRADVGTGKSRAARHHAAHMLARMRARGDKRAGVLAVPTHRLGEEQAAEFETLPAARAAGLTAAIWRGRDAEDPEAPGETMCRTPDLAREAREAGASVERACCRRNLENGATADCPFLAVCGYQHQRVVRPDLLIIPHDLLFTEKPDAIGDVAFLIVDESAWQDGLEGITGRPITLPLDNFLQPDFISDDPAGTAQLRHLRRLAFDALVSATDGPLTREAVDVVGITAAMAAEARRLEQKRWSDPGMRPALAGDERRKAAPKIAERNRTIRRMGLFWHAVEALAADGGPQASGWAELDREQDGRHVRMLRLKGRKPVGNGWHVPTLHLDANLNTDLLRYHWPAVELTADIAVEAPYQRVTQIADDLTFSKTRFLSDKDTGETEKKRRAKNLRDLHALLAAIGRSRASNRVLVVCQKEIEGALLARGWLPSNLEFAHHNDISGRDEWGPRPNRPGVVTLVIVGRTAPSPNEVERRAEALTGAAVPPVTGWYPGTCVSRQVADGSRLEAVADRHPNSVAEAIRWTICEGELVQISGRARGGNRTEENPVDMLVLTNVPLSIPIDATVRFDDLNPTPSDLMLAAGGIAFTNSTDAATAYHDLWSSPAAAKMAQNRARSVTNPYNDYIYGNVTHLLRWIYQLPGAGKRPAEAWVDVSMHPDPAAALAAKLGQLAWCRPADVTGEAAPAP